MSLLGCSQGSSAKRPNVLLVMTDQQTDEAMSCTGNPHVKTPAMDWIAARGFRFTRSYVTQPLCLPCRSSIQTGRYPHEIGTPTNGTKLNGRHPMLGKLMQAGGYDTAYFGKWHVGASPDEAGYATAVDMHSDADTAHDAVECLRAVPDEPFSSLLRSEIRTTSTSLPTGKNCRRARSRRHPRTLTCLKSAAAGDDGPTERSLPWSTSSDPAEACATTLARSPGIRGAWPSACAPSRRVAAGGGLLSHALRNAGSLLGTGVVRMAFWSGRPGWKETWVQEPWLQTGFVRDVDLLAGQAGEYVQGPLESPSGEVPALLPPPPRAESPGLAHLRSLTGEQGGRRIFRIAMRWVYTVSFLLLWRNQIL